MISEHTADATIHAFNEWFVTSLKNQPLLGAERAILKTFLYWQGRQANKGLEKEADASPPVTP